MGLTSRNQCYPKICWGTLHCILKQKWEKSEGKKYTSSSLNNPLYAVNNISNPNFIRKYEISMQDFFNILISLCNQFTKKKSWWHAGCIKLKCSRWRQLSTAVLRNGITYIANNMLLHVRKVHWIINYTCPQPPPWKYNVSRI